MAGLPGRLPWRCQVEVHARPVIRLSDAGRVAEYLREKTNSTLRNSRNRLTKMGSLRLEHIHEIRELAPIFDQLIDWYEVRQGNAHGKRAFETDNKKKAWHLRLLEDGLLHVTVLRAGADMISASLGMADGKTYSLAMPIFSPDYARYSPMALHFLMLVEQLHGDGYALLDLTPGPDAFKQRFAAEDELVHSVSIYFRRREWLKAAVRRQGSAIAKATLSPLGLTPSSLSRGALYIRTLLHRGKRSAKRAVKIVPEWPARTD